MCRPERRPNPGLQEGDALVLGELESGGLAGAAER